MDLRDLRDDLVEGRIDETVELDLAHGPIAAQRHPEGRSHDPGFGERSVDHATLTEILLQGVGDAEDTTEGADVLAHDDDLGVVFECTAESGVEGAAEGHRRGGHRRASSVGPKLARYSA